MFWQTTYEDLNKKIRTLDSIVSRAPGILSYDSFAIRDGIELCKEIQEDFKKKIRYPTKAEREEAWQKFVMLREDLYRIKREAAVFKSKEHRDEIRNYLSDADYLYAADMLIDFLTLNLMATSKEGLKWKGRQLREAGNLLRKYKHEMIAEHKAEVYERIVSIREEHDKFWERYNEYQTERRQIREEKKRAWEEGQARREQAKTRIKANIEKNKESLSKARDALERQRQRRRDLEDQISSAWSDSFKERAEGWLEECNDKISDIEDSIDRYKSWIQEGEDKLDSF